MLRKEKDISEEAAPFSFYLALDNSSILSCVRLCDSLTLKNQVCFYLFFSIKLFNKHKQKKIVLLCIRLYHAPTLAPVTQHSFHSRQTSAFYCLYDVADYYDVCNLRLSYCFCLRFLNFVSFCLVSNYVM